MGLQGHDCLWLHTLHETYLTDLPMHELQFEYTYCKTEGIIMISVYLLTYGWWNFIKFVVNYWFRPKQFLTTWCVNFLKIDKKLLFLCLSIGRKMTKVKNMQLINHSKK